MEPSQSQKRHAACDECRSKKLRCTGEQPVCARCQTKGLICLYALQKPMGRPRKRRLASDEDDPETILPVNSTAACTDENNDKDGTWSNGVGASPPTVPGEVSQTWSVSYDSTSPEHAHSITPSASISQSNISHDSTNPISDALLRSHSIDPATIAAPNMPSLALSNPSSACACACLSSMYLSLSALQSMTSFGFPDSLHHLHEAISCAWNVLHCPVCPATFLTRFQNIQLLGMSIVSTAERYSKIVQNIESETAAAVATGQTKKFRMGDLQLGTSHLHTSDPSICLAQVSVDLNPEQWRLLVRRVIKGEIMGAPKPNACCPSFTQLIDGMFARQRKWHEEGPGGIDAPVPFTRADIEELKDPNTKHPCLANVREAKRIIEHMALD